MTNKEKIVNKQLEFTSKTGHRIGIPEDKITGFCECDKSYGNCFIATGVDGVDGTENGWYVNESFDEVKLILEK